MLYKAPASSLDSPAELPQRVIVISQPQGAAWLVWLDELDRAAAFPPPLRRFRETLGDACWLARWSRNHVAIEVSVADLPEVIAELRNRIANASGRPAGAAGEELVRALTAAERF